MLTDNELVPPPVSLFTFASANFLCWPVQEECLPAANIMHIMPLSGHVTCNMNVLYIVGNVVSDASDSMFTHAR